MSFISPAAPPALLVLADGTVFTGMSIGVSGQIAAELVFNTAMSGYQEILTDPSYCGQIVTLTAPHIGNVGTNPDDSESGKVWASGLVIRDAPLLTSNFRSTLSLRDYLMANKVIAIAGVDTRRLTRHLRLHGAQNAALIALPVGTMSDSDVARATQLAQAAPSMAGQDLARQVTCPAPYEWRQAAAWDPIEQHYRAIPSHPTHHVVAYDFGIKHNILRLLAQQGCRVTVVPAQTPIAQVLALNPDGVFFSNGPGDPVPCDYAIEAARVVMEKKIPIFGICLGHQIMALASGAQTGKMKFGHHGANHPVKEIATGRVFITSQNHGFTVEAQTLPAHCRLTHISLFDQSCQGFVRTDTPAMAFQGHPEASPGPTEIARLFADFVGLMRAR